MVWAEHRLDAMAESWTRELWRAGHRLSPILEAFLGEGENYVNSGQGPRKKARTLWAESTACVKAHSVQLVGEGQGDWLKSPAPQQTALPRNEDLIL